LGRVASRYRMGVDMAWEVNQLGPLPPLTNAGWMLFAPLSELTLHTLADLARLDVARLAQIQTPAEWMLSRTRLPYCFRCLVLNPADVTAPRWKRAWLDPVARYCHEHGKMLETVPASVLRRAGNMEQLLTSVSRYRQQAPERHRRRLY
jgi:hypothetical protein